MHRLMRWKPSPSMVVSLIALFIALTTSAYAIDGPAPGVDSVGSQDIINAEVKQADIGGNAVGSGKVIDESLTDADLGQASVKSNEIGFLAIQSSDIGIGEVEAFNLATDSVKSEEIAPDAVGGGEVANGTLTGSDVQANSLTGSDINENTLNWPDGQDSHHGPCDPAASYQNCGQLTFSLGQPAPVLLIWTWAFYAESNSDFKDNEIGGDCRVVVDGSVTTVLEAADSDVDLFDSRAGIPYVDVRSFGAGTHTLRLDCHQFEGDIGFDDVSIAAVELAAD